MGTCISIVFGIEGKAVKLTLNVVSENCNLSKTSVESLRGRNVIDVSETEDIIVGLVLESEGINVKEASRVSQTCLSKIAVSGGGHQRIEVTIVFFDYLSSSGILENCNVIILNTLIFTLRTSMSSRSFSILMLLSAQAFFKKSSALGKYLEKVLLGLITVSFEVSQLSLPVLACKFQMALETRKL